MLCKQFYLIDQEKYPKNLRFGCFCLDFFKRFTSRPFLKYISLSPYAPIKSDECHALFRLNADSPAERNTEQVNITKNCLR